MRTSPEGDGDLARSAARRHLRRTHDRGGMSPPLLTRIPSPVPRTPSPPDSQKEWTPWTEVGDREELRRRLECLSEAEALHESQLDFVLFFFRASDPALYPLAAMIVGRQLDRSPRLASWLRDYARARGIPLGGRLSLTGTRSARRILLAAAATVARSPHAWSALAGSGSGDGPVDPLAPLPPAPPPFERPPDLVAYLRALRILIEAADPHDEVRARAREVLRQVADRPELFLDRAVALRWAELLESASRGPVELAGEEARELGRGAFATLRGWFDEPGLRGLGRRLALLRAMDGIVRGSSGMPEPLEAPAGLPGVGGFEGSEEELRTSLAEALEDVADPRRWGRRVEPGRARVAFFLLAAASEPVLPPRELEQVLTAFDLPPSPKAPARILRLLGEREGIGPGELVDAALIHSLEDEDLLLQLLPSGPPGELGAIVADALEHRLRMALATEPGFQPAELLARVEVRRPHPGFYQLLRTVVGDREFLRTDGEKIPLADWLEGLHVEARRLRAGIAASLDENPPVPGPLAEVRRGIRRGLLQLEGSDDPAELLRGLSTVLEGGRTGDEAGPPRDVRTLIVTLHSGVAPALERELHRRAAGIRAAAPLTVPEDLSGVAEARSAVEAVRLHLRALLGEAGTRLPAAEGLLLERVLLEADRVEGHWLRALSGLERAWRPSPGEEAAAEARWSRALEAVGEVSLPSHRGRLYPLVWRTLVSELRAAGAGATPVATDDYRGMERLTRWAVRSGNELAVETDRASWLGAVADHWAAMVEDGIEAGLESRVARLIRDPGPGALALLPGVDGILERARVWLFDCYRLGDAARVSRILNHRRGRGAVAALPRDLLAFFLHYSRLWLALLVGAILMLDFGDAWTAMAEVGDVRGIAITFSLGVLGAFGYVTAELHSRVTDAPGDRIWRNRAARGLRVVAFVGVSLVYTVALVTLLWWLLSGTDEVVHGEGAVLHVVVWSGFALFIGVFFGLMAKNT